MRFVYRADAIVDIIQKVTGFVRDLGVPVRSGSFRIHEDGSIGLLLSGERKKKRYTIEAFDVANIRGVQGRAELVALIGSVFQGEIIDPDARSVTGEKR